jgi:tyrosine aminotransferase
MAPNQDSSSKILNGRKIHSIWDIQMSDFAKSTANPHRIMAESSKIIPNPSKTTITLQMGDPTIFGNFRRPPEAVEAIIKAAENDKFSYYHTQGIKEARQAVADYVNDFGSNVTCDDVFLTSGGSGSLEMCFQALANSGENILVPRPCFNYKTWLWGPSIEARSYNLDPNEDWAIDLKHLELQIDIKTKAILINNVGNPCGNVFSRDHLMDILKIAEKYRVPIISDEIYEFFVFPGVAYHPIANLSRNVPIISCSGLTKRFVMPGVRLGWIVLHDRNNSLQNVRQGLTRISGRNFGPNSTVQLALNDILKKTPKNFFTETSEKVHRHASLAYNLLKNVRGLKPIMPKGAFYMMTKIELEHFPNFKTCLEFVENLAMEQSVLAFPGPCFDFPGYFRFVLTIPEEMISEACQRIQEFCEEHYVENSRNETLVETFQCKVNIANDNDKLTEIKREV